MKKLRLNKIISGQKSHIKLEGNSQGLPHPLGPVLLFIQFWFLKGHKTSYPWHKQRSSEKVFLLFLLSLVCSSKTQRFSLASIVSIESKGLSSLLSLTIQQQDTKTQRKISEVLKHGLNSCQIRQKFNPKYSSLYHCNTVAERSTMDANVSGQPFEEKEDIKIISRISKYPPFTYLSGNI